MDNLNFIIMNAQKYIRSFLSIRFIWAVLLLLQSVNSCTDKFDEYNTDKTTMMEVGPKQLSALFSSAIFYSDCWLTTDHYNRMSGTHVNHLCGYITSGDLLQEQNFSPRI